MIAATYTQHGEFAVRDVPVPEIDSLEMLLRVRATSICGSDTKIIRNGHRKLAHNQCIVLGHEFVGVIERIGSQVTGFSTGERVGIVPNAGCGMCDACVRGQSNYCPNYTAFGFDRDGAHAAYVKIPSQFIAQGNVLRLPASVSDQEASLLEPLSCVVNGVRVARVGLGDTVLIYGAGPMGLLHAMACRQAGAAKLVAVDPLQDRLERAVALGCDLGVNPQQGDVQEQVINATDGRGVDVVITACGVAAVQTEAVQLLAPFGRLCLFGGLPKDSGPVAMDTNRIHYNNMIVTGSTGGSVDDYRIALKLVMGKRIDLAQIVSNVFELKDLEEGYQVALAGAAGKVVFVER